MAYPGAGEWLADMNYRQTEGMISRMGAGNNGAADALAGGLMSRGAAIGRPLLSGAMGSLGLDPMSIGLKAGMGAWNMGSGALGAGLAGAGAMAGVGILGAGASFVGSQMYSGAQQQMQLNQGLRNSFNFINSQGGMGFTSQQGFQIGSALRGMTHDAGPQGEVATFGELSRLATNMGRMGFANNVRSVSEFKDKFKDMVDTLKKVATDMGSSLEEAQKFVQSMRGSGVFRTADQLKMSSNIRLGASVTGLGMSEFTGMANIGSQIARSVGGLGKQGNAGGIKAMEDIGLAQRTGALTDEDIYNATGLHDAEGRQALATSRMQRDAQFLSTSRGRRFLASLADKNGNLNGSAVNEYMFGSVSTSRTMELANQNLNGVGRANFIRNEGRLRGAVLEKFGGMASAMAHQQWLAERGYDPSNMGDKEMLAFQRFTGMGRDEADDAIKQINKLQDMAREKELGRGDAAYAADMAKYKAGVGIEGLKRKFDQTREKIQGEFQQAGADILRVGSDTLGSWFNKLMGIYERQQVEGVSEAVRMSKMGNSDRLTSMIHASSNLGGFGRLGGLGGLTVNGAGQLTARGGSSGSSEAEINSIIGGGVIQKEGSRGWWEGTKKGLTQSGKMFAYGLLGPLGALYGAGKGVAETTGDEARNSDTGAYARTEEGQRMIAGLLQGKGADYDSAMARIKDLSGKADEDEVLRRTGKKNIADLTDAEKKGIINRGDKAELDMLQTTQVSRSAAEVLRRSGKGDINDLNAAEKKEILAKAKTTFGREVSWNEVVKGLGSTTDAVRLIEHASTEQAAALTQKDIDNRRQDMVESGVAELTKDGKIVLKSGATKGLNDKAMAALNLSYGLANVDMGKTDEEHQAALDNVGGLYRLQNDVYNTGSIESRRAAAKQLGMNTEEGRAFHASVSREERLSKTMKKYQTRRDKSGKEIDGRFESAAAEYLGVEVTGDMREAFAKGNVESVAKTIMREKGITAKGSDAEAYQKELVRALTAGKDGKLGVAAAGLSSIDANATGEVKKQLEAARQERMGPAEKSESHLKSISENSEKQLNQLVLISTKLDKSDPPEGNNTKGGPQPGGGKT